MVMGRMGLEPILPVTNCSMLNFDGDDDGVGMCKQALRINIYAITSYLAVPDDKNNLVRRYLIQSSLFFTNEKKMTILYKIAKIPPVGVEVAITGVLVSHSTHQLIWHCL